MPTQRIHDHQMAALRKGPLDAGLAPSMDPFREFFTGRIPLARKILRVIGRRIFRGNDAVEITVSRKAACETRVARETPVSHGGRAGSAPCGAAHALPGPADQRDLAVGALPIRYFSAPLTAVPPRH